MRERAYKYGFKGVDCIQLAHDRGRWRSAVDTVMNLLVLMRLTDCGRLFNSHGGHNSEFCVT